MRYMPYISTSKTLARPPAAVFVASSRVSHWSALATRTERSSMDVPACSSNAVELVVHNVRPLSGAPTELWKSFQQAIPTLAGVSTSFFQGVIHAGLMFRPEAPYTTSRFKLIRGLLQHAVLRVDWTSDPTSDEVTMMTDVLGACISSLHTNSRTVLQQLGQFTSLRQLSVTSDDDTMLAVLAQSLTRLSADQKARLQVVELVRGCNTWDLQLAQVLAQSLGNKFSKLQTESVVVLQQLGQFQALRQLSVTSDNDMVLAAFARHVSRLSADQKDQLQVVELVRGCNTLNEQLAQELADSLGSKIERLRTGSPMVLQFLGQYTALRKLSVNYVCDVVLALLIEVMSQLPAVQRDKLQVDLEAWDVEDEQLAEQAAIALGRQLLVLHTSSALLQQLHHMPNLRQLSIESPDVAQLAALADLAGDLNLGQLHVCIQGQYVSRSAGWQHSEAALRNLQLCERVTVGNSTFGNEFTFKIEDGPDPGSGGVGEHDLLMYLAAHLSPKIRELVIAGKSWVVFDSTDNFSQDHYRLPLPAPVQQLTLQIRDGGSNIAGWRLAIKATVALVQDRLKIRTDRVSWDEESREQFMFRLGRDIAVGAPNLAVVIDNVVM